MRGRSTERGWSPPFGFIFSTVLRVCIRGRADHSFRAPPRSAASCPWDKVGEEIGNVDP